MIKRHLPWPPGPRTGHIDETPCPSRSPLGTSPARNSWARPRRPPALAWRQGVLVYFSGYKCMSDMYIYIYI